MTNPKVSVIVPTYKAAKYLPKCLDSLINQTFKNFEIIIVSDGPDEDNKIANEYALKDNRIKIIKDVNKGLGGARNAGLDIAKGEYIYFVDSDDWLEICTLETIINCIKDNNTDLVVFGVNVTGDALLHRRESEINYFKLKFIGLNEIKQEQILNTNVSTWNKLYKKEIIDKYNLRFPEKIQCEDFPFFFFYMLASKNAYYLNEPLYNYFRHDDCGMSKIYSGDFESVKDHITNCKFLYDKLIKNNLYKSHQDTFYKILEKYIEISLSYLHGLREERKEFKKYAKKIMKEMKINYSNMEFFKQHLITKEIIKNMIIHNLRSSNIKR